MKHFQLLLLVIFTLHYTLDVQAQVDSTHPTPPLSQGEEATAQADSSLFTLHSSLEEPHSSLEKLEVPDSILPYILQSNRALHVADYESFCQMRRLDGNTICLLRHAQTPEVETLCYIYNTNWKRLKVISFDDISLTQRPDTMSQERCSELLSLIEFPLVEARFTPMSADGEIDQGLPTEPVTLMLKLNVPLVTKEQRKQLQEILVQKNVKWNGEIFKEY